MRTIKRKSLFIVKALLESGNFLTLGEFAVVRSSAILCLKNEARINNQSYIPKWPCIYNFIHCARRCVNISVSYLLVQTYPLQICMNELRTNDLQSNSFLRLSVQLSNRISTTVLCIGNLRIFFVLSQGYISWWRQSRLKLACGSLP